MEKQNKRIDGIACEVHNCRYHDGRSKCLAGSINVGPSYASSSADTVCATFKPQSSILPIRKRTACCALALCFALSIHICRNAYRDCSMRSLEQVSGKRTGFD